MQKAKNSRCCHVCQYDSGVWTNAESGYDAGKQECHELLKALKKVRAYLYEVFFIVKLDAQTLVSQLNRSAADIPEALINCWIAWIQLFDFDVLHVPGKKHQALNTLSWRPQAEDETDFDNSDIEDFLNSQLFHLSVQAYLVSTEHAAGRKSKLIITPVLNPESEYSEDQIAMATYLVTLQRPTSMQGKEFTKFKMKALKHIVQDMKLFHHSSKNMGIHRVVNKEEDQAEIIWHLHDHSEHKGVEFTYRQVSLLYWWTRLYSMVKKHCQSCEKCQRRAKALHNDTIFLTFTSALFEKIAVNVIKMPPSQNKHYLVIAQDDFSDWVEEWALTHATSATVSRFLWENVITRHGVFDKLICDREPENKMWVKMLAELYGIDWIVVSAYNPEANGMVEREHKPLINALSKMTAEGLGKWPDLLALILWVNQTTIKRSTGRTPYEILYEYACILAIEARISTWSTLAWKKVRTCSDLLVIRAEQLLCHDMNLEETAAQIQQTR